MRRSLKVATLVVVASLGLTACAVPAALSQSTTLLGGSDYLQVHATLSPSGTGVSAQERAAFAALSFDVNEMATGTTTLEHSLNTANQELIIRWNSQPMATLIDHRGNMYVDLDFTLLAKLLRLAGSPVPASEVSAINLLFGGRWIELPFSVVHWLFRTYEHRNLTRADIPAGETTFVNDIVTIFAGSKVTTTPHGDTSQGSLASLAALISGIDPSLVSGGSSAKGTYSATLDTTNASNVTFSFSEVEPVTGGTQKLAVTGRLTHQPVRVSTPSASLVLTQKIILQLMKGGASGLLG